MQVLVAFKVSKARWGHRVFKENQVNKEYKDRKVYLVHLDQPDQRAKRGELEEKDLKVNQELLVRLVSKESPENREHLVIQVRKV